MTGFGGYNSYIIPRLSTNTRYNRLRTTPVPDIVLIITGPAAIVANTKMEVCVYKAFATTRDTGRHGFKCPEEKGNIVLMMFINASKMARRDGWHLYQQWNLTKSPLYISTTAVGGFSRYDPIDNKQELPYVPDLTKWKDPRYRK